MSDNATHVADPLVSFNLAICTKCDAEWEFDHIHILDAEAAGAAGTGLLQRASVWRKVAALTRHTECGGRVMFSRLQPGGIHE